MASSGQSWLRTERTFPRSPRLGAAGRGLAWHPRRAPAALAAWLARDGGAAAAGGAGAEGARSPPPPRDPAAKPAARAAQTGPATLGLRRDAPAHPPLDPRARRHEVTAGTDRGSAHRPGRAGPTVEGRDAQRRLLGLFCHVAVAGGRRGPRIAGQSTKPGGGQRASSGPSARIPARAAEGKGPQGPSATAAREREAGGVGGRTGTGHPAPSPAAFQTGATDEVIRPVPFWPRQPLPAPDRSEGLSKVSPTRSPEGNVYWLKSSLDFPFQLILPLSQLCQTRQV